MTTHLLSDAAEYGLRAVVWLAKHPDKPATIEAIAHATAATRGHLARVMQQLRKAEVVNAKRGVAGGYTLNVDPNELSVLDVLNIIDPLKRISRCPLGLSEHDGNLCALHKSIDHAIDQMRESFRNLTIAHIANGAHNNRALCDITTKATDALAG